VQPIAKFGPRLKTSAFVGPQRAKLGCFWSEPNNGSDAGAASTYNENDKTSHVEWYQFDNHAHEADTAIVFGTPTTSNTKEFRLPWHSNKHKGFSHQP
jgi:hypothetical protein